MGKAFEKQIKTIEDQGEKQIKGIQDEGQVKTIKKYIYNNEDTQLISKQKEIFNELVDETLEEITDLDEKVNDDNLIYRYKGRIADAKLDKFDNALDIIDKIRNGETSLTDVKSNQAKFKSNLTEVKKARKNRTKGQKDTLYNTVTLYKARNEAIKFYDNYSSMMSEPKLKATKRTILKLLTPKQMTQRLQ